MKLRKFSAPTMRQAMNLVRNALGAEAIIFSQKKITSGYEVEAGIEETVETKNEAKVEFEKAVNANQSNFTEYSAPVNPYPAENEIGKIQKELTLLRQYLENQIAGFAWQDQQRENPTKTVLLKRLVELGFSVDVSEQVISQINTEQNIECAWLKSQQTLVNSIPIINEKILDQGGIFSFVGPTGVGKTTSLAKIAARFILKNNADDIGLISVDSYRVAAREQLHVYGRILKVPVLDASNHNELVSAIAELSDRRLILIDTAGMSQRDRELSKKLSLLKLTGKVIKSFLVLSANSQERSARDTISAFDFTNLAGCVVTKVDEACSLGPVLSEIIRAQLPVCYVSNGQRVPEDLQLARASLLLNIALKLAEQNFQSISETELANKFAGELLYATE